MPWGASAQAPHSYTSFTATNGIGGTGGEGYPSLLDNNTLTKWCVTHFNGAYIEFCSATPIIPVAYVFTTAADTPGFPGRNPKTWAVKAKLNPNDNWTTIANESNNYKLQATSYVDYIFPIDNTTVAYQYFRFEVSATQGADVMQLAEFRFYVVDEPVPCLAPADIRSTSLTATEASFEWTQLNSAKAWQVCVDGNESNIVDLTETSYKITGLKPSTAHTVKVRAKYGNELSSWSDEISFVSLLMPTTPPYSTDFETDGDWSFVNGKCSNQWCWGSAAHNGAGSHAIYISNDGGVTNSQSTDYSLTYVVKPLELEARDYEFSYDWRADAEHIYAFLRVALVPKSVLLDAATNDKSVPGGFYFHLLPEGWIALDGGYKLNESSSWKRESNVITVTTAGTYNFVFAWHSSFGRSYTFPAAIDNVEVVPLITRPSDLQCTTYGDHATLQWTENGTATAWQVCLNDDMDNLITASTNPFDLSLDNLDLLSTYAIKVRAINGSQYSAWSNAVNMAYMPTDVQCYGIKHNSATLRWADNGCTAWQICLNDDEKNLISATQNPFTLTDLEPDKDYTAKIRADYGKRKSAWCDEIRFHTSFMPTDVQCYGIKHNSATLRWADNGCTAWQICLNDDEKNLISATQNPFTLTDLEPDKDYTAKIRADYGKRKSAWCDEIRFHTWSSPVEIPYNSDFETNCDWNFINGSCPNRWCWGEATHNGEGSHALYISNDGGVHSYYTDDFTLSYAIKPIFLEEDEYIFSYDWRCQGKSHFAYLRVALVPDWENLDAAMDDNSVPSGLFEDQLPRHWIALDGGHSLIESSDWQHVSNMVAVPVTGNYNMVFVWYNTTFPSRLEAPAAIDNVKIVMAGCVTPVNLQCSSVADSTATLGWTERGESTAWQICLDGKMDSLIDASTNSYALNGLSPGTTHEAKVRAILGDEQSEWSDVVNFTTKPQPSNKWLWFLIAIPIVIGLVYFWLKKRKNTK